MTRIRALVIVVVALVLLGGLFILLRPKPTNTSPRTLSFSVKIQGNQMSPGQIKVTDGDTVRLQVHTDHAITLHIHGVNVERDMKAGETATLQFKANVTGQFPIEDHVSDSTLGYLIIEPR